VADSSDVSEGAKKRAPRQRTPRVEKTKTATNKEPARRDLGESNDVHEPTAVYESTAARIAQVQTRLTVALGHLQLSIGQVLGLRPGAILELDKRTAEPVDILLGKSVIARGEVVVIDENFGIRVLEIAPKPSADLLQPEERAS
jgi:flagellar motor switch protein FliN